MIYVYVSNVRGVLGVHGVMLVRWCALIALRSLLQVVRLSLLTDNHWHIIIINFFYLNIILGYFILLGAFNDKR